MYCARGSQRGARSWLQVIDLYLSNFQTEHVDSTTDEMPTQIISAPSASNNASTMHIITSCLHFCTYDQTKSKKR